MKIHTLSQDELFRHLLTSDAGISEADAKGRLGEYGLNEIREIRRKPLALRFLGQFTHFLAILLWTAAGLSFLSEYLHPGEGMSALGFAILGVIILNAVFTFVQEFRAEKALEELKKLLPFDAKVIREGEKRRINAREVVPGDVLLLSEGDRIPADARLIESNRLMVNNAPLTGEPDAVLRRADTFSDEYLESPNLVFAGTLVMSGSGRAVAFATGMATEFGRIAHLTGGIEEGQSPLEKEIRRLSRVVASLAMATGIVFFSVGFFLGRGFWDNFLFAVGIIIANVPEGLLPTVTLSLAMGSQRMAKKNALIRNLSSVETLGSVTVICTDKTGTLTQNRMEVTRLWVPGAGALDAAGIPAGSAPRGVSTLMMIARLCNNATCEAGKCSGDPTDAALLKAAIAWGEDVTAERLSEIPFDAERKRMTTVHRVNGREFVLMKGALESVLPICTVMLAGTEHRQLDAQSRAALVEAHDSMAERGLRVIALGFREAGGDPAENTEGEIEQGIILAGLMGLEDPPRPEVPAAIERCRSAGIRILMITGDAAGTAVSIARQVGMLSGRAVVVEGPALEQMADRVLHERLLSEEIVFARMTPKHKMRIVSILKDGGQRVAVTGDGVNDAPALRRADVGIAMGRAGTDVAREAADIILLDDNFATIVLAIEEGRGVFENIRKFISYIFASNIPEIVPFIAYSVLGIPLPLTVMQILAIDLGTDMLPALALGAEQPTPDVMTRPPRKPEEKLLNLAILRRAYFFLGPFEALAGLFGFFYVLGAAGWSWGEMLPADNLIYMQATTACLGAIVITQIGNVFACRSFRESVFTLGFLSNRLILFGILVELLLAFLIIYTPAGRAIFGTAAPPLHVWLLLIPFSLLLLGAEEARKYLARNR